MNIYCSFGHINIHKMTSLGLHYAFKENKFFYSLALQGYKLNYISSRAPFLQGLRNINYIIKKPNLIILTTFLYTALHQNAIGKSFLESKLNLMIFNRNKEIEKLLANFTPLQRRKQFYYVHLDLPHAPFIFTQNGTFHDDHSSNVWGENEVSASSYKLLDYKKLYINQLRHLNSSVLAIVKRITSEDPESIIIIQGDHGTFTTEDDLTEHNSFFLAVRAPKVTWRKPETILEDILFR